MIMRPPAGAMIGYVGVPPVLRAPPDPALRPPVGARTGTATIGMTTVLPPLLTVSVTVSPGAFDRTSTMRPVASATFWPSTLVMTSPVLRPAFSDGPPAVTGHRARYPALPLLGGALSQVATVVLDDLDLALEDEGVGPRGGVLEQAVLLVVDLGEVGELRQVAAQQRQVVALVHATQAPQAVEVPSSILPSQLLSRPSSSSGAPG